MRPLVRALVALAAALCVWLVASPARAAAPICDKRGATAYAPTPQLQPPSASVDMSVAASCGQVDHLGTAVDRGDSQAPAPAPANDASLLDGWKSMHVPGARPVDRVTPHAAESPPAGTHARVERPPRG